MYSVLSVWTFSWWGWNFAWISSTSLYSFMLMKSTSSAYVTSGGRTSCSGWRRTFRETFLGELWKVLGWIHLLEVCQCLLWKSVVGLLHWFSCWSQYISHKYISRVTYGYITLDTYVPLVWICYTKAIYHIHMIPERNSVTKLHCEGYSYGSAKGPPRGVENRNLLSHPDDIRMEAFVIRMTITLS